MGHQLQNYGDNIEGSATMWRNGARQAVGLPGLVAGGVTPGMDGAEENGRGAGVVRAEA